MQKLHCILLTPHRGATVFVQGENQSGFLCYVLQNFVRLTVQLNSFASGYIMFTNTGGNIWFIFLSNEIVLQPTFLSSWIPKLQLPQKCKKKEPGEKYEEPVLKHIPKCVAKQPSRVIVQMKQLKPTHHFLQLLFFTLGSVSLNMLLIQ